MSNFSEEELFSIKLFSVLTDKQQELLWDNCRVSRRQKNEFLFSENPSPGSVYFVVDGLVIQGVFCGKRNVVTGVIGPGQFCHIGCISDTVLKTNFAVVRSLEAQIVSFPKKTLQKLIADNHEFALKINVHVSDYMEQLENFLVMASMLTRDRIVEMLKLLAINFGQYIGDEIILRGEFSHVFLAELCNTARQSVTQTMNQLKDENKILYTRRQILIRNLKELR